MLELRRTKVGSFWQEDALDISDFVDEDWLLAKELFEKSLKSLEQVLDDIPVLDIDDKTTTKVRHGQIVYFNHGDIDLIWLRHDSKLIGIGGVKNGTFKSSRVFNH